MPAFPEPYSTNNPSLGAAADFANSAPDPVRLTIALRAAADQQDKLKQQQQDKAAADYQAGLQRDFENHLQLQKDGAVSLRNPNAVPGRPTLLTPTEDQLSLAANGPGQTITDPDGDPFYLPTDEEKAVSSAKAKRAAEPPLDDTNSIPVTEFVADAVNGFYGSGSIKSGIRLPRTAENTKWVMDAVKDKISKSALGPSNGVLINQEASDRLKAAGVDAPAGSYIPRQHAADSIDLFKIAYPEQKPPPAAKNPNIERIENRQSGDITTIARDPDTGEEKWRKTEKGAAGVGRDPNAPKPATKSDFVRIQAKKATDLATAKTKFLAAVKDASPEDKAAAAANYRQDLVNAQTNYEQSIQQATGQEVPHNPWAEAPNLPLPANADDQQSTASPAVQTGPSFMDRVKGFVTGGGGAAQPQQSTPATQPAQPAAAPQRTGNGQPSAGSAGRGGQGQPKAVNEADLEEYVTKQNQAGNRKFTMDDARREAKQLGLKVIEKPVDPRAVHASAAGGH